MPTEREKREQLESILRSKTFGEAMKLSPFFRRLVEAEIRNEPLDEYSLGREMFGKPENWNVAEQPAVRQSLANLRRRLAEYYTDEGVEDLILIEFPKRMGYTPVISYNPLSDAVERVRLATYRVKERLPENPDLCAELMDEMLGCMKKYPTYAPAYALYAEILLIALLCDVPRFEASTDIPDAERAISKCLELDPNYWRAHLVRGTLHCCRFQWKDAEDHFTAAVNLEPEKARCHFWYAAYLLAVGRTKDALNSAYSRTNTIPENRFNPYVWALFRYVLGERKPVYDELTRLSPSYPAFMQDPDYYCGMTILDTPNWLVDLLMCGLVHEGGVVRAADLYSMRATRSSHTWSFRGLNVLTCIGIAKVHERYYSVADECFEKIQEDFKKSKGERLSLALACMALGKTKQAIKHLGQLCKEGHPLMVWLHLWPVFDPLRDNERFQALISTLRLPVAADAAAIARRAKSKAGREEEERRSESQRRARPEEMEHMD